MGITFTQENQVSRAYGPVDINGGAITSDWMSMKNYDHLTFLVSLGTHGGASTITVANATTNAGGSTADIAFNYRLTATTLVDDFGDMTAAAAAGVASDGATVDIMYAIEIDSQELTDGFDFVQVKMSDPAAATVVSIVCVGSRGRIKQNTGKSLQS